MLTIMMICLVLVAAVVVLAVVQYRATGGTPVWTVDAYSDDYQTIHLTVTAPDAETAMTIAQNQRLQVESIRLIPTWRRMLRKDLSFSDFRKRVPSRQIADMAYSLGSFVHATLPVQEAIAIYGRQKPDNVSRQIMRRIQAEISGGRKTIEQAFAGYSDQWGEEVVAILSAGMRSNKMESALEQIANICDGRDRISREWRKALSYPIIVLLVTMAALAFMLWKVVPTFKSAYASFNAKLPGPTLVTIAVSHFFFGHIYLGLAFLLALFGVVAYLRANEMTRLRWDRTSTRLPVIGKVVEGSAWGRAMSTLASLLEVGVPTQTALSLAIPSAGNKWVEKVLRDVRTSLVDASPEQAFRLHAAYLPESLVSFVETGAATAGLDTFLRRYAKFAQREAENAMEMLSAIVQPALLLLVAGVVGATVITLYLPMIEIVKVIK